GTGASGRFGMSIATSYDGGVVMLGSPADNGNAEGTSGGAVWVWARNATGQWVQQGDRITVPGAPRFGATVSLSADGSRALITAMNEPSNDGVVMVANVGSTYLFTQLRGNWSQQQKVVLNPSVAGQFQAWDAKLSADGGKIALSIIQKLNSTTF